MYCWLNKQIKPFCIHPVKLLLLKTKEFYTDWCIIDLQSHMLIRNSDIVNC